MNKKLIALVVLSALGTWGGANASTELAFDNGLKVRTDLTDNQHTGTEDTSSISIVITNNSTNQYGYQLVNNYSTGNFSPLNGSITAHNINIDTTDSSSKWDAGIWAQGNTVLSGSLSDDNRSVVTVSAKNLDIK